MASCSSGSTAHMCCSQTESGRPATRVSLRRGSDCRRLLLSCLNQHHPQSFPLPKKQEASARDPLAKHVQRTNLTVPEGLDV